jgi:hypothetical protein
MIDLGTYGSRSFGPRRPLAARIFLIWQVILTTKEKALVSSKTIAVIWARILALGILRILR